MITKNGVKIVAALLGKTLGMPTVQDNTGTEFTLSSLANSSGGYTSSGLHLLDGIGRLKQETANNKYGVVIGTGDTAFTTDDYSLANDVTTSFTTTSSAVLNYGENEATCYATLPLKNTSANAITIKELGLYVAMFDQTSTTNAKPVLFDRTLLPSPITIGAGETKSITYTIKFNYPTE